MEASHKSDLGQWTTVSRERAGEYSVRVNGGKTLSGDEAKKLGNYNALMHESCEYLKCERLMYRVGRKYTSLFAKIRWKVGL